MRPVKQIKRAEVVKRFDTIGQVGWWVVFQADLIVDGMAKPFTYVDHKYATEARANKELSKLMAKFHESAAPAEKKSSAQLDAEIAEALVGPSGARQPLRVQLSKGLGQAIRHHSGTAVFHALKNTSSGYMFESSDPGVVRAFWFATNEILHRPATRAIGDAVVKLRTNLRPIIETSWPEAVAR